MRGVGAVAGEGAGGGGKNGVIGVKGWSSSEGAWLIAETGRLLIGMAGSEHNLGCLKV